MKPTRRDNLLRTLCGQMPQWVPFAPNFSQWFTHHRQFGTLPAELQQCSTYIQAMKALGCDIFSRNVDGGQRVRNRTLTPQKQTVPAATGPRTTTIYHTPFGDLRSVWQEQTAQSTGYDEEYRVKDWVQDGDAFRYFLEQQEYLWDEQAFLKTSREIGEDGLVNVACGCTPLKMLHHHLGMEYTCWFVMDHAAAAKDVCDVYWQSKMLPLLKQLAASPDVVSVILMDNVDTPFYSPDLAAEYWTPYVKEAADLLHRHGKYLFVHACGKLAGLCSVFAQSGVDGLEGIAHPPLGDWTAAQAQACHPRFIFVGGFSAHEQQNPDDRNVHAFYKGYLPTARKERFIFAASCQTSIGTSWERLKLVRDNCREWGGNA